VSGVPPEYQSEQAPRFVIDQSDGTLETISQPLQKFPASIIRAGYVHDVDIFRQYVQRTAGPGPIINSRFANKTRLIYNPFNKTVRRLSLSTNRRPPMGGLPERASRESFFSPHPAQSAHAKAQLSERRSHRTSVYRHEARRRVRTERITRIAALIGIRVVWCYHSPNNSKLAAIAASSRAASACCPRSVSTSRAITSSNGSPSSSTASAPT